MATLASDAFRHEPTSGEKFIVSMAIAMAITVLAGFSTQLLMGRSTFASPLRVHVHAVAFMGWVALFVTQTLLATRGPLALHRKLGWIATGWMALMIGAAMTVIVAMARNGTVPFFFTPQQFLIADPMTLVTFVGLTGWAISRRRQTDWHARLHVCGMAALMGPAFGRLLPMPLMTPYAFEAAVGAGVIFPVAGMIRDRRVLGTIHPAWWYGVAALVLTITAFDIIAYSPIGDAIYHAATTGYPGANVPGLEFGTPPAGPLITGRPAAR